MNHTLKALAVGCLANSVAKTAVCPIDQVKTFMQASDEQQSVGEVVNKIYTTHGITGFWRGNTASLARSVPFAGLKYAIREGIAEATLGDKTPNPAQSMVIGAAAGSIAAAVTYPLDTIRTRMVMKQDDKKYSTVSSALATTIQTEGVGSLFNGVSTTIVGAALTEGTNYLFYNSSKRQIESKLDRKMTRTENVGLGIVTGIASQSITYPIDTVRKKLQIDKNVTITAAINDLNKKGISSYYPGLFLNSAKVLPTTAITLAVREALM